MTSPIRSLSDRAFDELVEADPAVRARNGLPFEHLKLNSEKEWQDDAAVAQGILDELAQATPIDEDDRLTAGHLEFVLGMYLNRAKHEDNGFTVTPYQTYGLKMSLGYAFAGFTGSPSTYVALAADYRDAVTQMQSRLERQRELGILVPKPALAGVRRSLALTQETALGTIIGSAPSEVADAPVFDEVRDAFEALLAYLDDSYEQAAPDDVCLSRQPGGEAYYRSLVHESTASDFTPEQLHQVGLDQVAELADAMAELRAQMGFTGTEEEFHAKLAVDPRVHATDPDEVNALFLRHMAALEPLLPQYFSVMPKAPYGVSRVDPQHEAGMTYGYYEHPTAANPIGQYRWNGADLENKSLLTYAALIFHELAPGHHFHIARQGENEALPKLRREQLLSVFAEGWAEYASGLGWEMGLYADPLDAYGRLVHERFTAQRLVVDTGLNLYGWSLDKAAAYMRANTTDSAAQVASEVLRYSTDLPAQALAYRAGYLEFMRLRAKTEAADGDRFDLRDFHEHLLGPGGLPFPVIDASLERRNR